MESKLSTSDCGGKDDETVEYRLSPAETIDDWAICRSTVRFAIRYQYDSEAVTDGRSAHKNGET